MKPKKRETEDKKWKQKQNSPWFILLYAYIQEWLGLFLTKEKPKCKFGYAKVRINTLTVTMEKKQKNTVLIVSGAGSCSWEMEGYELKATHVPFLLDNSAQLFFFLSGGSHNTLKPTILQG